MRRPLRLQLSPSVVLATVALFFALGGSAFAIRATGSKTVRCPAGSVRAIAYVAGDPHQGIENLPTEWSSGAALFKYRYSCSGGAIQVRKSVHGYGFDLRFLGNPGKMALATTAAESGLAASVMPEPDGTFHVSTAGDAHPSAFVSTPSAVVVVLF